MKDHLKELVEGSATVSEARLVAREYLQARVLEALQRSGAFSSWAFLGGTALRFLYRLPRFSEDLDFSRIGPAVPREVAIREFLRFLDRIRREFAAEAYDVDIRDRSDAVVQSAFVGFPGLLHELGLSSHRDEKISIKIEVDTNPPKHAATERSIRRRHVLLNLLHYDKASLFAGKLHAIVQRPYVKGRDVYDLVWYLGDSDWPEPNLPFLRAALAQSGVTVSDAEVGTWRTIVADRVAGVDWERVVNDVAPFLERSDDLQLITRETVLGLLVG
jgi:predicted nucleotidyltransferase component of viral defense system